MKTTKKMASVFALMLMMTVCFSTSNVYAQNKKEMGMKKDCCMMKDGKMMLMKDGKMMPMEKDMTLKNGTKCMVNGECVMKDGKKMMMKEGDCMDMNGKMDNCGMKEKGHKGHTNSN
ncbi:MAG: hypothetical protein H7296_12770 [Bacteroidia bacterium]|nr:hypothetical protein [Bacteroidia bacterium]